MLLFNPNMILKQQWAFYEHFLQPFISTMTWQGQILYVRVINLMKYFIIRIEKY